MQTKPRMKTTEYVHEFINASLKKEKSWFDFFI